jgi:hypothetical protein
MLRLMIFPNGYCRLCLRLRAALLYIGFQGLSLHSSAYMAIFKSVGFFIYLCFHIFKDSASLFFFCLLPFFTWSHSACFPFVFCSCAAFLRDFLCFFASVCVHLYHNLVDQFHKCSARCHTLQNCNMEHNSGADKLSRLDASRVS